uniref:(northern house mosquito) hypothetical protein n=1 Tax=Culex pipiens TaxID=7175 RepID=A0A8D8ESU5_CULPI
MDLLTLDDLFRGDFSRSFCNGFLRLLNLYLLFSSFSLYRNFESNFSGNLNVLVVFTRFRFRLLLHSDFLRFRDNNFFGGNRFSSKLSFNQNGRFSFGHSHFSSFR